MLTLVANSCMVHVGRCRKVTKAKAEVCWAFFHLDDLFVSWLLSASAPGMHTAHVQCECRTWGSPEVVSSAAAQHWEWDAPSELEFMGGRTCCALSSHTLGARGKEARWQKLCPTPGMPVTNETNIA